MVKVEAPQAVLGAELGRTRFLFAFSLVTSLFFAWGFAYGLLDVLNKKVDIGRPDVFGITKTQSTLLQFAYFGAYIVFSPFAGIFMKRYGYKKGIYGGLTLYCLGAIFFWPSAHFEKYGAFVGCTFVTACGLATLEVAANSYITVLGTPKYAAFRLTLAQAFNGIATICGPLIASSSFFSPSKVDNLTDVQWVYLGVFGLGVIIIIGFYLVDLPELKMETTSEDDDKVDGNFWKQTHLFLGFWAEFLYVGAQVGVASLAVNYITEQPGTSVSRSTASNWYAACQATFTVGRFVGVGLLKVFDPAVVLAFHGLGCVLFAILTSQIDGYGGIVCLFFIFYFESVSYPVIFSLATSRLGKYAKPGAAIVAMGVGGGAWYPSAQAALADSHSTQLSYIIPVIGFVHVTAYGIYMWARECSRTGDWRITYHEDPELDFGNRPGDEEARNAGVFGAGASALPISGTYADGTGSDEKKDDAIHEEHVKGQDRK